jgi:hypothetical protein
VQRTGVNALGILAVKTTKSLHPHLLFIKSQCDFFTTGIADLGL